jgi:glyoxylase-like metal-dependent hydrolase (beta-lactamase superfamily II)
MRQMQQHDAIAPLLSDYLPWRFALHTAPLALLLAIKRPEAAQGNPAAATSAASDPGQAEFAAFQQLFPALPWQKLEQLGHLGQKLGQNGVLRFHGHRHGALLILSKPCLRPRPATLTQIKATSHSEIEIYPAAAYSEPERSHPMNPQVQAFFDEATNTITYLVRDPQGAACAVIDSVLDFDYASGRTDTRSADAVIAAIREQGLDLAWVLETHVHADHLSAAPYLQEALGGQIGIGAKITQVQETFGKVFNEGTRFARDGSQFDRLFAEGDSLMIGQMRVDVMHTPGHTPACLTYVIGDAAFVGDTLFMPDFGTARCDFPGGSAEVMYESVQRILALPEATRIFVAHDYKAPGREVFAWETTVGAQKALNVHVGAGRAKADFIALREARDATLAMPRLIIPSLQINMRAGQMPEPEDNGTAYLKVPLNGL